MEERKSHKNPMIKKIYDEFLGKPNSHKAHELLHTHYHKRDIYPTEDNCCNCSLEEAAACGCEK
jgi:NADH-quinone oxidoreductase subunit G/NADP-reducing hydrogenase subunit HndD